MLFSRMSSFSLFPEHKTMQVVAFIVLTGSYSSHSGIKITVLYKFRWRNKWLLCGVNNICASFSSAPITSWIIWQDLREHPDCLDHLLWVHKSITWWQSCSLAHSLPSSAPCSSVSPSLSLHDISIHLRDNRPLRIWWNTPLYKPVRTKLVWKYAY